MDSVSNGDLFSAILSSNILVPYQSIDHELAVLLETPNHCNIHYPRNHVTAGQILTIFRQRLDFMLSSRIYLNLESTKQLVGFIEENMESQLYYVTFNCEKQHYDVCCGLTGEQLQVICVMTGGHIPDELFGESSQ
ncbi:MAG: hypothetical protein ACM3XO_21235 [Bacteroidota bacterium]